MKIQLPVIRNIKYLLLIVLLLLGTITPLIPKHALALSGSDFNASRIIDDPIFFDSTTLGASDIQAFLNSKVPVCDTWHAASSGNSPPFTCLKDFRQDISGRPADQYCSGAVGGGNKSAAEIIKDVSVACSVSPKVLIVLLQKEQSLVTDTWPWAVQYEKATGYYCPDDPARPGWCDPEYAGFFNQVWYAARQFQRYTKEPQNFNFAVGRTSLVKYQANNDACGGTNLTMQNGATAALYNYTPYQPNAAALANLYGTGDSCSAYGNRNFWRLYSDWFGSPVTSKCSYDPPSAPITGVTFRKYNRYVDQANLVIYTGSSTNCIESHTWNVGVTSWASHLATNHPNAPPDSANVQYADLDGDGVDEAILVGLNNTGSGKVEFHIWNRDMNRWTNHIISDAAAGMTNGKLVFADVDGDGRDEPVFILYNNTGSGKVEFHVMNNDLRTWRWHVATQLPALDPANGTIDFGDIDGDGVDEAVLVLYRNTNSGQVEFHTWNPGWWSWRFHTASNLPAINPADAFVTFADIDGNGVDEAILVSLRNNGSGRVEFHTWNLGVTSWRYHTASNLPAQ